MRLFCVGFRRVAVVSGSGGIDFSMSAFLLGSLPAALVLSDCWECCVSCFWVRQSFLGQVARWSPLELSYCSGTHHLVVDVGRRFTPFEVGKIKFFVPLSLSWLESSEVFCHLTFDRALSLPLLLASEIVPLIPLLLALEIVLSPPLLLALEIVFHFHCRALRPGLWRQLIRGEISRA